MKKQQLIFIFLSIFISVSSFAQVLISDKEDKELNSSAILQLDSTVKGFLMPRMTNDERLAIDTPAAGLQVYVIDFEGSRGIVMFYNGKEWKALTKIISGPSAPIDVQATISNGEAIVTFNTPDNDGGSTITQYTATSDPGELSNTIEATEGRSITISGLDANTFYTFTVTATNEVDTGLSSESSNVVPGPEVGNTLFGGKVFYILTAADPGYVYGETHGLICAFSDLGSEVKWHPDNLALEEVTGTKENMGYGTINTNKIKTKLGKDNTIYAAYQATLYNAGDGYTGWYLPSKHELNRIFENLKNNDSMNFKDNFYWSSSEKGIYNACRNNLTNNHQDQVSKSNSHFVRPVRSF